MDRRALLLAFVVALLGIVLLVLYTKRYEREMSGGEKVKLLIAIKPIERGKPITDDQLSTREIPQAYVEDRAIKEVDYCANCGSLVWQIWLKLELHKIYPTLYLRFRP